MMSDYCAILLAAGRSTRFGGNKLLAPLPDGTPVALASARALRAVVPRVVAIVGERDQSVVPLLVAAGATITTVPETQDGGMGVSLAAGIVATPDASGWIVGLADMPFIRSETVARIRGALADGAALAAPVFDGRRGHPVGFSAEFRIELMALRGDQGARWILQRHSECLRLVDCADPGVLRDIDVPADLPR